MSSSDACSAATRYARIQPDLFGFRVEVGSRRRVAVEVEPWRLRVRGGGADAIELDLADRTGLQLQILERLKLEDRRTAPWPTISLEKGIERHRLRLLGRVPSEVCRVHERIHGGAWHGASHLHRSREFYDRRYLISDVLKFRAAAIAVSAVRVLCKGDAQVHFYDDKALERLETWPALFSPDDRAYVSLRRTLMNLPWEVPAHLLPCLRLVHLPRPVTDPLELTTICAALDQKRTMWRNHEAWPSRIEILLHAKATEIRGAIARVAEHTRQRLDPCALGGVLALVRYLDFPDIHAGRLGGLVEKALRWHGDIVRRRFADLLEQLDLPPALKRLDTPTGRPSFPVPEDPHIRFLDTVGSIFEEGRDMGHCVASFAETAARGLAHFFHVEIGGENATVALHPDGSVFEATGPGNSDNEAVRWGRRRLEECSRSTRQSINDVSSWPPVL